MFRACVFEKLEAVDNPATGDTGWLCDAAAAMGTENKESDRGEVALRKIDANTLAACARDRVWCSVQELVVGVGRVWNQGGMDGGLRNGDLCVAPYRSLK